MSKTTVTTTSTPTTTTLCKTLLLNASYTTNNKFVGKSAGETVYKNWIDSLKELKHNSFLYYEALANERANIADFEKDVYTSIKKVLAVVGDIPTKDNPTVKTKINSKILFADSVAFAVKTDSKIEVKKLTTAREQKKQAVKAYRDNCLTKDGIPKNGLNADYVKSFETAITTAQAEIDKLLKIANNSVYGTTEVSISTFAKKFEIQLRKQMLKQYHFTVKEAKEQKQALKTERKKNRKKAK